MPNEIPARECPGDQQGVTNMRGFHCSSEVGHWHPDTWTTEHVS